MYETGPAGTKIFVYGNYIDEVLYRPTFFYYVHDHLYSPVAITLSSGAVYERYEYDAYGNPTIWQGDFISEKNNTSNPYLFTGRRADYLDSVSLKIQYNRRGPQTHFFAFAGPNCCYDYYKGRWMTLDPLNYIETMNLYG